MNLDCTLLGSASKFSPLISTFQRSSIVTAALFISCNNVVKPSCPSIIEKPLPHCSTLDKSFPVPRGRIATGGGDSNLSLSIASSTHATVPSPPQTKTLK